MPHHKTKEAFLAAIIPRRLGKVGRKIDPDCKRPDADPVDTSQVSKSPPSDRYRHYRQPEEGEHRALEQLVWIKSLRLAVVTMFAAVAAAIFACLTWYQTSIQAQASLAANQMNLESGRAWLGTSGASITQPMVVGARLTVSIDYKNMGREPAKETEIGAKVQIFSQDQWDHGAAYVELAEIQAACMKSNPTVVHGISFPTAGENAYGLNIDRTDDDGSKTANPEISRDVVDGQAIVTVSGCFAYLSAGKVRHTAFCYNYQTGRIKPNGLQYCLVGNDAD